MLWKILEQSLIKLLYPPVCYSNSYASMLTLLIVVLEVAPENGSDDTSGKSGTESTPPSRVLL